MITENIVLRSDSKKQLKHLGIDKNAHVSDMLIEGAIYLLKNDFTAHDFIYDDCEGFTMKIDKDLKSEIKQFCKDKGIKIKDFWNEVADITIQMQGDFVD